MQNKNEAFDKIQRIRIFGICDNSFVFQRFPQNGHHSIGLPIDGTIRVTQDY